MKLGEHLFYQDSATKDNPPAIITHRNCPDGSASAVLGKRMSPSICWFPATHNKINEQVLKTVTSLKKGANLYVVDISCDEDTLKKCLPILNKKEAWMGIYDHHETTKWLGDFEIPEVYCENIEIVFDNDRCGSKIFYDQFISEYEGLEVYKEFIDVNNDRDLWLKQDSRSDDLARLHELLQDQGYVERFYSDPTMEFSLEERVLLDHVKKQENLKHEKLLRNIQIKTDSENYRYGVVYGEADSSNLLNKAMDRFDLEYALLINLNSKKGSIRGKGNKDCSLFAANYGGGGHRCASGFQIKFNEPSF